MNEPHIFTTHPVAEFHPTPEISVYPPTTDAVEQPPRPTGDKFVTFFLGGSLYAVPASKVLEVTRPTTITPLPHAPQGLLGIAGVRGEIVAVIDLRSALNAGGSSMAARSKLVILHAGEQETRLGFLVDAMHEIASVLPEDIAPADGDLVIGKTGPDVASLTIIDTERLENLLISD